jgi:hypothetical protein
MRALKKYIILIALSSWLIYFMFSKTYDNYLLKKNGLLVKGIVITKKVIGGKGTINIEYYFITPQGENYNGESNNEKYNVGDSIEILYLKSNPNVNASKSFLENY